MEKKGHFRRSPRPLASHPVILHLLDGSEISTYTKDVSRGGLFVAGEHSLPLGARLEVSLSSPSTWEPLRLTAEVCRIITKGPEPGMGLKFVEMTDRQLTALIDLTHSLDFES